MFCILSLCIILCATSKASEYLNFVLKQILILSSVLCCHHYLLSADNATENSSKTFARAQSSGVPLNKLSHMKLRWLTWEQNSKNIPKSSKIHDYIRRAHVLHDVSNAFHERTCKHESIRKSDESSERRFNLQAERVTEVIRRPGVFRDRDKLGRTRVLWYVIHKF